VILELGVLELGRHHPFQHVFPFGPGEVMSRATQPARVDTNDFAKGRIKALAILAGSGGAFESIARKVPTKKHTVALVVAGEPKLTKTGLAGESVDV
jgi:hypothetical protein